MQVAGEIAKVGANINKLKILAVYGGQPIGRQLRVLNKGVHIVVGTPGRVIDHIERGSLNLIGVDSVVLDEADEMLNMGNLMTVAAPIPLEPPVIKTFFSPFPAVIPRSIFDPVSLRGTGAPFKTPC